MPRRAVSADNLSATSHFERRNSLRVGLFYELFGDYEWRAGDPPDADAELEPEETLIAIEQAFRSIGVETLRVGGAKALLKQWSELEIDLGFSIAEGAHSRNREAYVPVLLELAGIPFLGSDALTMSASLDKAMTKDLAAAAGLATPPYRVVKPNEAAFNVELPAFPLFVKPRYEGSSKGITPQSRVETLEALLHSTTAITATYGQDALVEAFVEGGGEFTVCVIGNDPPRALPVLQRAVEATSRIGLHALEHRGSNERPWQYELGGSLTPDLEARLQADAIRIYEKLECLDYARMDFRTDQVDTIWFLEANPLPTFAPDGTFAVVAELEGRPYVEFLGEVFEQGIRRLGLR